MATDIRQLLAERDGLKAENADLRKKVQKLEEDFAQQQTSLHELMSKTGAKLVKPYEYGPDECRPVHVGEVCEKCGFDYVPGSPTLYHRRGREKEGRAAHPVA